MEAVVDQGQSLLDVALQHCGDVSVIFDIAVLNGVSVTEKLKPGTVLILPEVSDAGMVRYFFQNNFIPATDTGSVKAIELPEGIDYWAIGIDFIVS
ncbi:hypothetical protein [Pedobacter sp. WC2423]|uniref:hypothetical protein n=1 Tax=Pedobacter sp. WC2423 TaxID=3234142 RepID=UPI003467BA07